ncbi:uncharacterized protein LOC126210177 isoform X3 [Schistocerca nitens]|uniref:uncharacterized protein LOC126210177 isoform X3 n=1 Tax=Schistocerca nitens TaxID=7011 RepID=UPI002118BF4A|nr:uncharacterized protein LOC126210177 isoform X3 [Schistocerca nitens]XP_049795296.1 uncharacterized protein LOC126210177 isoform X3 [Schistocerca nitens]XP_049795297.1 uncharacterized protein LOC126210177 isoform X3 [Schistocerca nitens]
MEWLQMSLFHISLLLLAGYLVTATHAGAGDNQTASTSEWEVPWVACATLECDKPCPTLPPSCPSGIIKKCGCCDVCWKYLNEGQLCRKFLQGNTLCGPGLVCSSSGLCEHLPNVSSSEEESPE